MQLSISNIAWELSQEESIAGLLRDAGLRQIDIAPGKYFTDPEAATPQEVLSVRNLWQERGFTIRGMQSLLFGTSGLNLFDDRDGVMFRRLAAICRLGGDLGVHALTFGSPRQRDRGSRTDAETAAIATDFFGRIGDVAASAGVLFCLEPNPPRYGCNYMTGTDETAGVVAALDHPAVKLQLDVGAIAINDEDAGAVIRRHAALIGHVHASEPGLVTLGDGGAPHAAAGQALRHVRPELTVTIEMLAGPGSSPANEVSRALALAQAHYGEMS
ncbi:sugar phosphate isomerase/epimerase [Sphingomonas sp. ABOLF]|uniref:sugar phosphate isomerase/epimerase family protein n=1 Tax=Sphingomonas sp. ABOLF TaxID=1985879 RepID=UPI000F7D6380|nr:sugar phosphate isomerase/epimerase [Sphingomonas sp. ABOLF]RSV12305.1 sugar phosphate isomerase/epimerase [Sphingomonas sp. ABOLF]